MSHDILFVINACSSFFMAGLIWFVQVVQYPSFMDIDESDFQYFHQKHIFRTGLVVTPAMLLELTSSAALSIFYEKLPILNSIGFGIVVAIWLSTLLLQAPTHGKLQKSYDKALVHKLISTNWIRTGLWSLKALLSLYGYCYFLAKWGN